MVPCTDSGKGLVCPDYDRSVLSQTFVLGFREIAAKQMHFWKCILCLLRGDWMSSSELDI